MNALQFFKDIKLSYKFLFVATIVIAGFSILGYNSHALQKNNQ